MYGLVERKAVQPLWWSLNFGAVDSIAGKGMAEKLRAAHVALLVLLMPPGILAQLPDAPTPSMAVSQLDGLAAHSSGEVTATQNHLGREGTVRAAVWAPDAKMSETGVSSSVAGPEEMAAFEEGALDP